MTPAPLSAPPPALAHAAAGGSAGGPAEALLSGWAAHAWTVTAAANLVMVAAYAAIAFLMVRAIVQGRQLVKNPLLTATAAIFVTCTIGHGVHLAHVVEPLVGLDGGTAFAARAAFSDPRLLAWDAATAGVALWYWSLRGRFAVIFRGAALCEDMEKRERDAFALHDNVVQGLVRAKLAFDVGDAAEGARAVDETFAASKRVIASILGEEPGVPIQPGDFRRQGADRG